MKVIVYDDNWFNWFQVLPWYYQALIGIPLAFMLFWVINKITFRVRRC